MAFFHSLLSLTAFRSPLLRTVVPCVAAAFAIQTAAGIPSIAARSERFYDASGSLTFLAVGALSLYLPVLRARAISGLTTASLPSVFSAFQGAGAAAGGAAWNWRQVVLTGMVTVWCLRLGSYLFQRILNEGTDARFDSIRTSPPKFAVAFFAQAVWVSACLMPVLAVNAIPAGAFAALAPTAGRILATDVLGLALWVGGFAFEVTADRQKSQWAKEKKEKMHDEEFLTRGLYSKCRFPNYFGEITLWTGIATLAAGVLARRPVQLALGLSGGAAGILTTTAASYVSPAFAAFLLLKVSGVPLSESKYDKRFGGRKDYEAWKRDVPRIIPKLW